jgi:hypothetical protein
MKITNKLQITLGSLMLATLMAAPLCQASDYSVDAYANSSIGGTAVSTISLTAGQSFSVSVGANDLWSAGALPRWSDANGLTHDVNATGGDESGQSAGTQIGADFGLWTQDGFSAPYGALVGIIGNSRILLGTSYNGTAPEAGTLKLVYWDSNNSDNSGSIKATVTAVPEPSTIIAGALLLVPFGASVVRNMRKNKAQ